jgi:hypothetical protein
MNHVSRPVLFVLAALLVLAGMGLYRWLVTAAQPPAAPAPATVSGLPRLGSWGRIPVPVASPCRRY